LGEAIELLARKARLLLHPAQAPSTIPFDSAQGLRAQGAPSPDLATTDSAALSQWVNRVASQLGIEAEPVESSYVDADRFVRGVAPAILYLPQDPANREPRWLALVNSNSWRVSLLAPDQLVHYVSPRVIRRALCAPLEAPRRGVIDELLARAGVAPDQRQRVGATILAEQLSGAHLGGGPAAAKDFAWFCYDSCEENDWWNVC
jgi:hypothetical protein